MGCRTKNSMAARRKMVRSEAGAPSTIAAILAGGRSSRMGQNKALMAVEGRPMIAHIVAQLRPFFRHMVVSATDADAYAFLRLPVVTDILPDEGPMVALASVLHQTDAHSVFVMPCDVPHVPMELLMRLLDSAHARSDIVVPVSEHGRPQPFFALYRRSVLPLLDHAIDAGIRRVVHVFDDCVTTRIPLEGEGGLVNLNTPAEYQAYVTPSYL